MQLPKALRETTHHHAYASERDTRDTPQTNSRICNHAYQPISNDVRQAIRRLSLCRTFHSSDAAIA